MSHTSEIAAVSGATGFIGSAIVRKLLAGGRPVRALIEPGASLKNLDDLPRAERDKIERVTVDVCDHGAMKAALEGAAAYYHLAAIYKLWVPDPRAIYRVNIEGTTASLLAAQAAGVHRIVYTSSIAAVGYHPDGRPADETTEFNNYDIANEYILTKMLSERIAMQFAAAGLPVVVVNPAFPFGPRDVGPTPTGASILALLRKQVPGIGEGGLCAVDVDHVAAAHVAAETKGRIGERYILGDHNVTFREFCEVVCEVAGIPMPKLSIPSWVGKGFGFGMEQWARHVSGKEPMMTYKGILYLQRRSFFDCTKARTELGLQSTPLRESVARAVEYFRANGMV